MLIYCRRIIISFICVILVLPAPHADAISLAAGLPPISQKIGLTESFHPIVLDGIMVHPEDQTRIDFIVPNNGQAMSADTAGEKQRILNYFLTALTIPSSSFWVNLSPYEPEHIVPDALQGTFVGRDLLVQDYLLKQLVATLMDPNTSQGARFWKNIYHQAKVKFGTTQIPVSTINKVWIVPGSAVVNTRGHQAVIQQSKLKVMLENDYLAQGKNNTLIDRAHKTRAAIATPHSVGPATALVNQVIKDTLLPVIEKEINEGKRFANLRQIYRSLILGVWYKKHFAQCGMMVQYINKEKKKGLEHQHAGLERKIFTQYTMSYKRGVVNIVREESDEQQPQPIVRKYFSGGFALDPKAVFKEENLLQGSIPGQVLATQVIPFKNNAKGPSLAMTATKPAKVIPITQALIDELQPIIKANNTSKSSRLAPFVFGTRSVAPYRDSIFGGYQLLTMLMGWIGNSRELTSSVTLPKFKTQMNDHSKTFNQSDFEDDVDTLANFFGDNGWLSATDVVEIKMAFREMPAFIKTFNPEMMVDGTMTFEKMVNLISRQQRVRSAEEEHRVREESMKKAEEEFLQYGKQALIINMRINKGLQEMLKGEVKAVEKIGEDIQVVTYKSGLKVDQFLRWRMASDAEPLREISYVGDSLKEALVKNPSIAFMIFKQAVSYQVAVSPNALEIIRQFFLLESFSVDQSFRNSFIELLRVKKPMASFLMQMNQVGMIKALFPFYEQADKHYGDANMHLFPLSAHSLYLFQVLEQLPTNDDYAPFREMYEHVLEGIEDELLTLRLSIILHDMYKSEDYQLHGMSHTVGGANELVPVTLKGFPLNQNAVQRIQWLVWNHQTISPMLFESKVFIDDYFEIYKAANNYLTLPMFQQLVLITLADGSSVNPLKEEGFLENRLRKLLRLVDDFNTFFRASDEERFKIVDEWHLLAEAQEQELIGSIMLDLNKLTREKIISMYQDLPFSLDLKKKYQMAVVDSFISNKDLWMNLVEEFRRFLPFNYLRLRFKYGRGIFYKQLLMLQMLRVIKNVGYNVVLALPAEITLGDFRYFELFVGITPDRLGLLQTLSGVLAALGLNILESRINTTNDGVVLDSFQGYFIKHISINDFVKQLDLVLRSKLGDEYAQKYPLGEDLNSFLPTLVKLVIDNVLTLDDVFNLKEAVNVFQRSDLSNNSPTHVRYRETRLDNDTVTQINLETPDRNGLIFSASKILASRGITIVRGTPSTPQHLTDDDLFVAIIGEDGKMRPLTLSEQENLTSVLKKFLDKPSFTYQELVANQAMSTVGGIDLDVSAVENSLASTSCEDQPVSIPDFDGLKIKILSQ